MHDPVPVFHPSLPRLRGLLAAALAGIAAGGAATAAHAAVDSFTPACAGRPEQVFGLRPPAVPLNQDELAAATPVVHAALGVQEVVQGDLVPAHRRHASNLALHGCTRPDGRFALGWLEISIGGGPARVLHAGNSRLLTAGGVSEAALGDAAALDLALAFENTTVRIRGWQSDRGTLVTAARLHDGGRLYQEILYGELSAGDPLAGRPACIEPDGHEGMFQLRRFTIATARFTAEVCAYPSGGRSSRYAYLAIDVSDSSEALPPALRGTTVHLEPPALAGLLVHQESHHNWCDNFYLRVPALDAEYVDMAWPEPLPGYPFPGPALGARHGGGDWQLEATPPSPFCRP
jgi:hypothetical protein